MFSKYRKELLIRPGMFHIYNRGNNGDKTFFYPCNYNFFLDRLSHFLSGEFEVYSYCLMENHFHILGRVVGNNCIKGFRKMFQSYAMSVNRQTGHTGSVFEKTYCRLPVTTETHLRRLFGYINTNPRRHGLTTGYELYPYSSYQPIVHAHQGIVNVDYVYDYFGGLRPFLSFIEGYAATIGMEEDPFQ